jgi:ABC-type branched-subunit amino acid transport system substrate-binding protein
MKTQNRIENFNILHATPQPIYDAIHKLVKQPDLRRQMSEQAYDYAKAYVKAQEENMKAILEPLV